MAKENLKNVITDLRKSLAWLDLVLATLKEGVITLEKDMKIHFANDAIAHLLHADRIFLLGSPIWEALSLSQNGKILKKKDYINRLNGNNIQSMTGIYNLQTHNNNLIVDVAFGYIPKIKQAVVVVRDITLLEQETALVRLYQKMAVAANESTSVQQALQTCLDLICQHTGWPVGHVYLLNDNKDELIPTKTWYLNNPRKFKLFRKVTEATPFKKGIGLPGRVLANSKAAWITNVKRDKNFPRAKIAKDIGVKAGFAFPVLIKKEVAAVLEFFAPAAIEPDEQLLKVMTHIGTQLGRVIERKRAEESRVALAREHEARKQAETVEEKLQEAVTLRDNFISVASHELRTPITSVKIFTQILQKHSEQIGDEKAKKHLAKMDKQLNKLIELIYNLLNISKIQAGRMEFNQKLFDFDASVKEIIDVLQEGASKHKLIIDGKTGKKIYGDEDRISQVLSNLVANAIKYSPHANKIIIQLTSDKNNVIICVEDFGIGLAKKHLEKIFERFYRVFDTTDKTFPGLGIGLYISSEIIKRHHGKLWVESDIGKGSKFYFSLPLHRDKRPNGVSML